MKENDEEFKPEIEDDELPQTIALTKKRKTPAKKTTKTTPKKSTPSKKIKVANLSKRLQTLTKTQLVDIIDKIYNDNPELRGGIESSLPKPDIEPMKQEVLKLAVRT